MAQVLDTAGKEKKLPLFVMAYETLYQRIRDNVYKPGDKLPSENQLSKELNISRGTLRQAMLLLQEDGLIMNFKGKGSFVLAGTNKLNTGIERIENPMLTCSIQPIDKVVTELQFQPATEKHRKLFNLPASSLVALVEFYYYIKSAVAGLALVFMPYDLMAEYNVPLNDNEAIHRFYNEFLETDNLYSESAIRIGFARQSTANKMGIEEKDPILLMEENFYLGNRTVLAQKLFFSPAYYELKLLRRNERYTTK